MNAETLEVATYGRNSDKRQDTSQAIQADTFEDFCTSADGFSRLFGKPAVITENYKDHGKSASKKKTMRDDFNRMLTDVSEGKQRIVLVLNTSRFSRLHPVDTLKFLTTFRDSGAHLVSIEDRKVYAIDELGDLITTIVKFNSDHEYARSLSANILRGTIRSIKQDATAHVSLIPYGMAKLVINDIGERKVYPRTQNIRLPETWKGYLVAGNETEVSVVRWIFQTYLDEDLSFCQMARRLNNHNDPQVRAGYGGIGWDDCRIKKILTNRHYRAQEFIGVDHDGEHYQASNGQAVATKQAQGMEPKPLIVPSKFPPVIEPEIFEQAQAKLQRKKGSKPKCLNSDGYSLTGSFVCGHCGKKMVITTGGKFVCKSGRSGKTQCRQWGIAESEVLPWLVARIDKKIPKRLQDKPVVIASVDTDKVRQQIATMTPSYPPYKIS